MGKFSGIFVFFQNHFCFKKFFQEHYQRVKHFGSKILPTKVYKQTTKVAAINARDKKLTCLFV